MRHVLSTYMRYALLKFWPKAWECDFKCLVCSFGGVGTTFFMEFINRYLKTNDIEDKSGYKHINAPPNLPNSVEKVIYVYGDPVDATISLFRRGYARAQAHKNGNHVWIRKNLTLAEYAEKGKDLLFLTNHFINWTNGQKRKYDVIFIRYEKIWENLPYILDSIGIPPVALKDFPKYKKRQSGESACPFDLRERLAAIYIPLYKRMNKLSDVEVI